jgi:hypothetical protein
MAQEKKKFATFSPYFCMIFEHSSKFLIQKKSKSVPLPISLYIVVNFADSYPDEYATPSLILGNHIPDTGHWVRWGSW